MNGEPIGAERPHVMIVDSFALLFRGFYALAVTGNYMRNSKGLCTNGLYQFTRYLMDAVRTFRPTHVVCAFDMGQSTFRNERYPDYKAHRDEPPAELIPQFDKLWELVDAFDIPCVGQAGFEADDVIGTLAKRFAGEGATVSILTGDGDSLQLLDEHVRVILLKKGFGHYEVVTADNLFGLKGVRYPRQIIEMKGLMGDVSDNIPGCPGIGEKTALKLLAEFGDIDNLFANIDSVKGKLKDKLLGHREQIYLSRELATIRTDVELDLELDACVFGWNRDKLMPVLQELEFHAIMRSISQAAG